MMEISITMVVKQSFEVNLSEPVRPFYRLKENEMRGHKFINNKEGIFLQTSRQTVVSQLFLSNKTFTDSLRYI